MHSRIKKLLKRQMEKSVEASCTATTDIFNYGRKAGFEEGLQVAEDYINTIVFQDHAEYPLSPIVISDIFGTNNPNTIFKENDIKTIMKKIKKYTKNKKE